MEYETSFLNIKIKGLLLEELRLTPRKFSSTSLGDHLIERTFEFKCRK